MVERLLKTSLTDEQSPGGFRILNDELFYRNLMEVYGLRKACRQITNYVVTKRCRQRALLTRMEKKVPTVTKLQAAIRGHLCRVLNRQKVEKIRRDGLKGTKKYKAANKIQALYRGFAFRIKRKRALAKLTSGNEGLEGDEMDLDFLKGDGGDFDAEAFLNVKQENLEQADIFSGANASLMEKYIQVLSYEQK